MMLFRYARGCRVGRTWQWLGMGEMMDPVWINSQVLSFCLKKLNRWCCHSLWVNGEGEGLRRKKKNQELCFTYHSVLFPDGSNCKESACNEGDPWVGKIPWRRQWQPSLVFLPGESHGQRRLTGYRSWGHKESDTTEWLTDSVLLCYKRSMLKDNNWQSKSEKESEENFRGQRPLLSYYTPGHLVPLFLVD